MRWQSLPLTGGPIRIEGAVSLEKTAQGIKPWRLPFHQLELFEPALVNRAVHPAGVRLTLQSNTSNLCLAVEPLPDRVWANWSFDLLVDGKLHERQVMSCVESRVHFRDIPEGEHRLEVLLPNQYVTVCIRDVRIDADATASPVEDDRPRWIIYGSDNTMCAGADGPSCAWPAIVAQRFGLHLTNLGYPGQDHMETMVGRMLRDMQADYISMSIGISTRDATTVSDQTFRSSLVGMIQVIREGHPRTPIAVTSAIFFPDHELVPSTTGTMLRMIRQRVREGVESLRCCGDANVHHVDGLELFGPDLARYIVDGAHPNNDGYRVLAERYSELVMPKLGLRDATK